MNMLICKTIKFNRLATLDDTVFETKYKSHTPHVFVLITSIFEHDRQLVMGVTKDEPIYVMEPSNFSESTSLDRSSKYVYRQISTRITNTIGIPIRLLPGMTIASQIFI